MGAPTIDFENPIARSKFSSRLQVPLRQAIEWWSRGSCVNLSSHLLKVIVIMLLVDNNYTTKATVTVTTHDYHLNFAC